MLRTLLKSKKARIKISKGYTLLEVVLVMAFTAISFMALYGIFAKTIQGDTESQYEIIASNLAQECIERVRNCRDNKVLANPLGWDISNLENDCKSFLTDTSTFGSNIENFSSGGKNFNSDLNITDSGNNNNDERLVTCTVSWASFFQGGLTRKVEVKSLLTNWQKQGS